MRAECRNARPTLPFLEHFANTQFKQARIGLCKILTDVELGEYDAILLTESYSLPRLIQKRRRR